MTKLERDMMDILVRVSEQLERDSICGVLIKPVTDKLCKERAMMECVIKRAEKELFKTMDALQIDNYNRSKRGELIGE